MDRRILKHLIALHGLERWIALTGYEGLYEVSSFGNVRSLERRVKLFGKRDYLKEGKEIKVRSHYKGYKRFCVHKDNVRTTILVHRAVAMAFLLNPDDLPIVNHKDLNKQHNHIRNLEWVTCKENTQHYYDNAAMHPGAGAGAPSNMDF